LLFAPLAAHLVKLRPTSASWKFDRSTKVGPASAETVESGAASGSADSGDSAGVHAVAAIAIAIAAKAA